MRATVLAVFSEVHRSHVMTALPSGASYLGRAGWLGVDQGQPLWRTFLLHSLLASCPTWHWSVGWSRATGTHRPLLAPSNQPAVFQEAGKMLQGRPLH